MNLRYERNVPENRIFMPETKIIWHPDEVCTYYDRPKNSHCLFRKKFCLTKVPQNAVIDILADSRYVFYVNGRLCGRGPCRSDPRWKFYDTIDITDYLAEGENLFSAEVLYYGYDTGHSIDRIPAFFAECCITFTDGSKITVHTDKSWKTFLPQDLNRNAPRINGCKGCIEVWDMKNTESFTSMESDDDLWVSAKERDVLLSPFWNLYPKPISNIQETPVKDYKIIYKGISDSSSVYDISQLHIQLKHELENISEDDFEPYDGNNIFNPVSEKK